MSKHCEVVFFFIFLLEETPSQKIGFFCLYFLGCGIEGSVQIFQTFGRHKDTSCPDKSFSFCWWTLGRVKHGGRKQDRKRIKHCPCCSVFLWDCNLMHSSSDQEKSWSTEQRYHWVCNLKGSEGISPVSETIAVLSLPCHTFSDWSWRISSQRREQQMGLWGSACSCQEPPLALSGLVLPRINVVP